MFKLRIHTLRLTSLLLLSVAFLCSAPANAQSTGEAGFQRLAVTDPVSGKPIEAVYFYPSARKGNSATWLGPYHVSARHAVSISSGRYPLVIISHGNAGSLWSHHDLATSLAKGGNIVITLNHPGDNYKDHTDAGSAITTYGRPLQISAAISAALNDPSLNQSIDSKKIAFIGFSSGGETGLLLGGGKISPENYADYCRKHPTEAMCSTSGKLRNNRPDLEPRVDPRIKAWILMAPVSAPFSRDSLQNWHAPTLLFSGDKDEELFWQENAGALAKILPGRPTLKIIHGAGHYVFLSPCSPQLRSTMPRLCNDPPGIDRTAVHRGITSDIERFLTQAWLWTSPGAVDDTTGLRTRPPRSSTRGQTE